MDIIKNEIERIANSLNTNFIYNDWSRVNYLVDKEVFKNDVPIIISIKPASGGFIYKNGIRYESQDCMILFMQKINLDITEVDDQKVDVMKELSIKFIEEVNASRIIELDVENIDYKVIYDALDANLGGLSIEVKIKEIGGRCGYSN